MAGVITTAGLTSFMASAATFDAWVGTLTLRLYVNNHTPVVTDTAGAYTEATFPGYAAVSFGSLSHTDVGIDGNNNYEVDWSTAAFGSTGSNSDTVYGYFITDGSGNLCFAELAPTPQDMSVPGTTFNVNPRFFLGQLAGSP